MKKEIYILIGLIVVFSLIPVLSARADTLTDITVTPSSSYGSHTADYTITFTTITTILAASTTQIALTFPSGFDVANAATSTEFISGTDFRTATSSIVAQDVELGLSATTTNLGASAVSITLTGIVNPAAGGSTVDVAITETPSGAAIDSGTSAAFTIIACCPARPRASDTIPPTSNITSPTEGTTIPAGKKYVIAGAGTDVGGSTVQRVEVSLDGGQTWSFAQSNASGSSFSWQYVWQNPTEGEYVIQVRATDSRGNRESPSAGVKVTVAAPVVPTVPPAVSPEKPITEMTVQELEAKILEIQQKIIDILGQLIQLFQQQIQALLAK